MIRYTFFVLAVMATAATAIAAVQPSHGTTDQPARNITVIEKTSPFPVLGPIIVEECAVEDCSDVKA